MSPFDPNDVWSTLRTKPVPPAPRRRSRKHGVVREQMIADARALREEGGLGDADIAAALGICRSTLYRWIGPAVRHNVVEPIDNRLDPDIEFHRDNVPVDVVLHGHSHETVVIDVPSIDAALSDAFDVPARFRVSGAVTFRPTESDDIVYRDEPEPEVPVVPSDASYARWAGVVAAQRRRRDDQQNARKRYAGARLSSNGTLDVLTASHANRYTPRIADDEETDRP